MLLHDLRTSLQFPKVTTSYQIFCLSSSQELCSACFCHNSANANLTSRDREQELSFGTKIYGILCFIYRDIDSYSFDKISILTP